MKPYQKLVFILLLSMTVSGVYAQLSSSAFPSFSASLNTYTKYVDSDSIQTETETIVRINMTDTAQLYKVHVELKGASNNLLQQQRSVTLNETEVYTRTAGINYPVSYEVHVKFAGNYAQEKLEIELENRTGEKSAKFVSP